MPRNSCHLLEKPLNGLEVIWLCDFVARINCEHIDIGCKLGAGDKARHPFSLSNKEQSSMRCPRVNNRAIFPFLLCFFSLFLDHSLIPLWLQPTAMHSISLLYYAPHTLCHLNCVWVNLQANAWEGALACVCWWGGWGHWSFFFFCVGVTVKACEYTAQPCKEQCAGAVRESDGRQAGRQTGREAAPCWLGLEVFCRCCRKGPFCSSVSWMYPDKASSLGARWTHAFPILLCS